MRRPIQSFNVPHGRSRAGRLTKRAQTTPAADKRTAAAAKQDGTRERRTTQNTTEDCETQRNTTVRRSEQYRHAQRNKRIPRKALIVFRGGILLSPTVYSPPQHLSCFMKFRHNSGYAGQSACTPSVCFRSDVLPRLTSAATCRAHRFRRFHNLLLGNRPQRTERSESRKTCGLFRRFGGISPRQNGPLNFGFVHAGARAHYTLCRAKFFA